MEKITLSTKKRCEKCEKLKPETSFQKLRDGTSVNFCKECLTMHIDNYDPETFIYLLKKFDVPYVPQWWNEIREKAYAQKNGKLNGLSVFGKYIVKMKLKQYKEYHFADSEKLCAELGEADEAKKKEIEEQQKIITEQYENGEIGEAEFRTYTDSYNQMKVDVKKKADPVGDTRYKEENFLSEDELIDPAAELTHDDKIQLAMKWGRLYKPHEWVELERHYTEMTRSFDIQDADTASTLIVICKTYLKMNQALDAGDIEGYQKLSKVYDSLRKSTKFTAAQNKSQNEDTIDCVGKLVALCEREGGFIPRYPTEFPQDQVDKTLKDMNSYTYKLVTQDLGLGQRIEDQIKKIQIQQQMEEDYDNSEPEDIGKVDFNNLYEYQTDIEEQKEHDEELINTWL